MAEDRMPTIGEYRNVGLHDFQDQNRIEEVVKPAIDFIYQTNDIETLLEYAGNYTNPPEARAFAGAKIRAAQEFRAGAHEQRIKVDLEYLTAALAGVDSLHWADPVHYGCLLNPGRAPGEKRPERPPHQRARLEAAQAALEAAERAARSV